MSRFATSRAALRSLAHWRCGRLIRQLRRTLAPLVALLFLSSSAALKATSPGERRTDPTQPPLRSGPLMAKLSTEPAKREFDLSAVLFSDGRRIAVINGTRVRVGDRIGNAVVVDIAPTAVRLQRENSTLILSLFKTTARAQGDGSLEPAAEEGNR